MTMTLAWVFCPTGLGALTPKPIAVGFSTIRAQQLLVQKEARQFDVLCRVMSAMYKHEKYWHLDCPRGVSNCGSRC
jgi:hypothetical protein